MGKQVFTLRITTESEDPNTPDAESGHTLSLSPELLYQALCSFRSELLADADCQTAWEFGQSMDEARLINTVLEDFEKLLGPSLANGDDDDDYDDE